MSGAPDDPNVHPKPSDDLKKRLQRLIEAVRLPAGSDPRFVTGTVDASHRDEFTAAVHSTWKGVQAEIIQEIVTIENVLARPEASRMPPGSADWLRYLCRIGRRVNDAIAWNVIGQPETVKRLCAHHVRPTLIDSNPASVAAVLDDINKDSQSIAIWNDATTFLDVGDITARRSEKPEELSFIELKAGPINLAVLQLQDTMRMHRRAGQPEKAEMALDEFYKAYGKKGFQQLMRVTKQLMRDTGAMADFNAEVARTADRPHEVEVERVFSERLSGSYDPALDQILRNAERNGAAFGSVDGCLWVYVFFGRGITRQRAVEAFTNQVFASSPATRTWLLERTGKDILHPVVSMDQWFFVPTALPPFLRLMEASDIVEILHGRFKGRVLLFFDWQRFEQTVQQTGCTLTWVRPQPVDGKNVHEIVGRRTPRIGHPNGQGLRLNKMFLSQILAEGMFPEAVAAQCARMLEGIAAH